MKILIDNGHGMNAFTNGKYSPNISSWDIKDPTIYDNRFREGNFNRIIAKKVYNILKAKGYVYIQGDGDLYEPDTKLYHKR